MVEKTKEYMKQRSLCSIRSFVRKKLKATPEDENLKEREKELTAAIEKMRQDAEIDEKKSGACKD